MDDWFTLLTIYLTGVTNFLCDFRDFDRNHLPSVGYGRGTGNGSKDSGIAAPRLLSYTNEREANRGGSVSDQDRDLGFGISESHPLYRLKVGIAPASDGITCAKKAGLPIDIIARAEAIKIAISNKRTIEVMTGIDSRMDELLKSERNREMLLMFLESNLIEEEGVRSLEGLPSSASSSSSSTVEKTNTSGLIDLEMFKALLR